MYVLTSSLSACKSQNKTRGKLISQSTNTVKWLNLYPPGAFSSTSGKSVQKASRQGVPCCFLNKCLTVNEVVSTANLPVNFSLIQLVFS